MLPGGSAKRSVRRDSHGQANRLERGLQMRLYVASLTLFLACAPAMAVFAGHGDPTVQELLENVGIKPSGDQRGQMDTIGFASAAGQMDEVVAQSAALAAARRSRLYEEQDWTDETSFVAAVCPHDDYSYAGRLYSLLIPHIKAKTVIVFGVFHKARVFDCRDRLVFDSYRTWRGPYGPVAVSTVREDLLSRLPDKDYVIDNDMQMVEHSVEAIVPWLQAYNREVEIVSVLVPYMGWEVMESLAGDLAAALESIVVEKNWTLGEDLALVSSADAVHYGDAGWGGNNFADFGSGISGYERAVARDLEMGDGILGPYNGEEDRNKLKDFLHTCVNSEDVTQYRVTWCGRFSIPFGLGVAARLVGALKSGPMRGTLLDYGTSVSEASLNLETIPGLGTTAPNNLHHFVGYAAIGYE